MPCRYPVDFLITAGREWRSKSLYSGRDSTHSAFYSCIFRGFTTLLSFVCLKKIHRKYGTIPERNRFMLRIAVVDDEKAFCDRLYALIRRYGQEHSLETEITCFQDGLDITDDFKSRWDIIFLDIQMKHLNGIETAKRIRTCDTEVILIFVTTMAQYAINGYEVDALDYVLKPVEYPQFAPRMTKAVREVKKKESAYLCIFEKVERLCKGLHG